MATLLSRLQINTSLVQDQIKENSPAVQKHLETMPDLLPQWAQDDMRNSNTGGYYQNPVSTVITNIQNYCSNIKGVAGITQASNTSSIYVAANTLYYAVPAFIAHTNRLSGVTAPTTSTINLPHLDSVINNGKILSTLLYQVDGVNDNTPMIGGFSSLYTGNTFTNSANVIITFASEIQNSMNVVTVDDGMGNTYTTYTSNLTTSRASVMINSLNDVTNQMHDRRVNDETYYTNSKQLISEYSGLRKFSRLGATETDMFNNLVGTDKLKSRINS
jgi:hypothetical protein